MPNTSHNTDLEMHDKYADYCAAHSRVQRAMSRMLTKHGLPAAEPKPAPTFEQWAAMRFPDIE